MTWILLYAFAFVGLFAVLLVLSCCVVSGRISAEERAQYGPAYDEQPEPLQEREWQERVA